MLSATEWMLNLIKAWRCLVNIYIDKQPWERGPDYKWWQYRSRPEIKLDYVEEIRQSSHLVSAVSATAARSTSLRYKDQSLEGISMAGVTDKYFNTAGLNIETGRIFTAEEIHRSAKVVVVGSTIAEKLFNLGSPLKEIVRIEGQEFRVIGILEKQGNFLGLADMDRRIISPITAYGQIFDLQGNIQIVVKFPSEKAMQKGEYEIEGIMRRIRQLDATEENNFEINKPQIFKDQLSSFKSGLFIVGGVD